MVASAREHERECRHQRPHGTGRHQREPADIAAAWQLRDLQLEHLKLVGDCAAGLINLAQC